MKVEDFLLKSAYNLITRKHEALHKTTAKNKASIDLHIKGGKTKNQACKRAKHCAQGMLKHGTKCRTEIRKKL